MRPSALMAVASPLRPGPSIVIWDAVSGQQIIRLKGHDAVVLDVEFNPKGDILASTSVDGTVRLWNTSTGDQIAVLKADGNLQKALFSPDGQLVLTTLNDNTARIWKIDGKNSPDLVGHENRGHGRGLQFRRPPGRHRFPRRDCKNLVTRGRPGHRHVERPQRASDGRRVQPGRSIDLNSLSGSNGTNMAGQGWGRTGHSRRTWRCLEQCCVQSQWSVRCDCIGARSHRTAVGRKVGPRSGGAYRASAVRPPAMRRRRAQSSARTGREL